MLGWLLAISITAQCTVVRQDYPAIQLNCEGLLFETTYQEWPLEVWPGPHIGGKYNVLMADGKVVAFLPTLRDEEEFKEIERRSRQHQLRWFRPPTQRKGQ